MADDDKKVKEEAPQAPVVQVAPVPAPVVQVPAQSASENNGLAVASMITGILGLLGAWAFFGGLPAIAALIMGILALKKPEGKGMAITGIITGALGIIGVVIMLFIALVIGILGSK